MICQQVGKDQHAAAFLGQLDKDPMVGHMIDCVSDFELEQVSKVFCQQCMCSELPGVSNAEHSLMSILNCCCPCRKSTSGRTLILRQVASAPLFWLDKCYRTAQ